MSKIFHVTFNFYLSSSPTTSWFLSVFGLYIRHVITVHGEYLNYSFEQWDTIIILFGFFWSSYGSHLSCLYEVWWKIRWMQMFSAVQWKSKLLKTLQRVLIHVIQWIWNHVTSGSCPKSAGSWKVKVLNWSGPHGSHDSATKDMKENFRTASENSKKAGISVFKVNERGIFWGSGLMAMCLLL